MRWTSVLAILAMFAVLGFLGTRALRAAAQGVEVQPAKFKPFVVTMFEQSWGASDPSRRQSRLGVHAFREDGSQMSGGLTEQPDHSALLTFRSLLLVSEQLSMQVSDKAQATATVPVPKADQLARKRLPQDPTCRQVPGRTFLGETTFLGYPVVRLVIELPAVRREELRSPDLGCFALSWRAENKDAAGAIRSVTEGSAIKVAVGSPQADLFAVPATYARVAPSKLEELHRGKNWKNMSQEQKDNLLRMLEPRDKEFRDGAIGPK